MLQALRPSTTQALELVLLPNADLKAQLVSSKIDSRYAFAYSILSLELTTQALHRTAIAAPVMSGSDAFFSAASLPAAFSQVQPPSVCWFASTAATAWSRTICGTRCT